MRKKKYFKAVYSAHIDFKDKEDLNRQRRPLKPGEHYYLKSERNVYYSDIVETIKTAINAELKEERKRQLPVVWQQRPAHEILSQETLRILKNS